jgi:hypothetical protein
MQALRACKLLGEDEVEAAVGAAKDLIYSRSHHGAMRRSMQHIMASLGDAAMFAASEMESAVSAAEAEGGPPAAARAAAAAMEAAAMEAAPEAAARWERMRNWGRLWAVTAGQNDWFRLVLGAGDASAPPDPATYIESSSRLCNASSTELGERWSMLRQQEDLYASDTEVEIARALLLPHKVGSGPGAARGTEKRRASYTWSTAVRTAATTASDLEMPLQRLV